MTQIKRCPGCHKDKPTMKMFADRFGMMVCESCYMERTKLNPKSNGNTMPLRK